MPESLNQDAGMLKLVKTGFSIFYTEQQIVIL